MLEYLKGLLAGEDAFTVTFWVKQVGTIAYAHCHTRVGVVHVDATGIVVERKGAVVAVPWTSVQQLEVEVI